MPFFNYGKKLDQKITSKWKLGKQLGSEGKDGYVCEVTNNNEIAAMKIFKNKKSINKIKKELDFQKQAALKNIAPPILSDWEITENSKCFVMQKMNRTLLSIVKEQNNTLNQSQIDRLIELYTKLTNIKLLHNDPNILKNIMENNNGELFLIDFGFTEKITIKNIKVRGPNPNLSLLACLDHTLKTNYFSELISNYEKKYDVIIDIKKHMKRKREFRIKRYIDSLNK